MDLKRYANLQPHVIKDVVRINHRLGVGSFGSVEELLIAGKRRVAGKIFHEALLDPLAMGVDRILKRFSTECQLLSKIDHPNIVSYIGVCFLEEYSHPVLLMELLHENLDRYLSRKRRITIPMQSKLLILLDVAKGLTYLHGQVPPIIHRDLTSRNVLLNSDASIAKIADLGNAHVIDLTKASEALSRNPGTLVYMPPETMDSLPYYDTSLDIFSFGHLSLYTVIEEFPGELLPYKYYDKTTSKPIARSEIERRKTYIDVLQERLPAESPLLVTIRNCLEDLPHKRYMLEINGGVIWGEVEGGRGEREKG